MIILNLKKKKKKTKQNKTKSYVKGEYNSYLMPKLVLSLHTKIAHKAKEKYAQKGKERDKNNNNKTKKTRASLVLLKIYTI